jgi:heptosyltransferase-2
LSPNILVIRLSSLGDIVLTGPVYKSLKALWPDCRITVLVKPAFADVLRGHPGVDDVLPFEGLWSCVRVLRAKRFSHVLDLHGNIRSKILRWSSGAPQQSVYRKDALARRLFVAFGFTSPALSRHVVDRYLEAAAAWGAQAYGEPRLEPADWGFASLGSAAQNVVILQTSFLGDSLLTLPLVSRVKEKLPGAKVSVLTLPKHAAVFQGAPGVDAVLLDDKRGADSGFMGLLRAASRLRREGFDLAVIPHRSFRSALLALLAGIPRRLGFSTSAGRFMLTDVVPFAWMTHDLDRNLALAGPLGERRAGAAHPRYVAPPPASASLQQLLTTRGAPEGARLAGVHPGAAWATKRWLPERFEDLCRRLRTRGYVPVLIGGPDDRALGARLALASGAVDLTGQTSLEDLKALMGRLSLFVTNDSGPMHLAAAAGVPVVAIFGPTTRELGFFPYGEGHKVVEAPLACRPCGLHGGRSCPEGHFLCMRLLTVDAVEKACVKALA